jgi:hypothetical protein
MFTVHQAHLWSTIAKPRRDHPNGGVKAGVLYGNNIMVKLLTQFRDSIRPKRTHSEVVGHVTLEQSVDARFKKAKLEDKVIDISDTIEEQIIANSEP